MATSVVIVHPRDYVRATPDGTLDRAASERPLVDVATASRGLADFDVILDLRHAHAMVTVTDLWYLAQYLAGLPELRTRRVAIVAPAERFDLASFFALAAQNRGLRVRAFASFEEAIDWLAEDRTELPP